jgi:hypothetical protein
VVAHLFGRVRFRACCGRICILLLACSDNPDNGDDSKSETFIRSVSLMVVGWRLAILQLRDNSEMQDARFDSLWHDVDDSSSLLIIFIVRAVCSICFLTNGVHSCLWPKFLENEPAGVHCIIPIWSLLND